MVRLAARLHELIVPDDLVYFVRDNERLVTNPKLATYCILDEVEFAVLQALARAGDSTKAVDEAQAGSGRSLDRIIAKLVLNWLIYLPGGEPELETPRPALREVYYAITDGCNLRCPYCYASSEKCLPDELTTMEASDLVDQAAEAGAAVVIFTGGEPMIRRDLFDVAGHARSLGLKANIITNATLIPDKATAQRVAETFSLVTVSLDGGCAETHDRTRGHGSFARTAKALHLLNDCGVAPKINHVMTSENIDRFDELGSFLLNYETSRVRLMMHSNLGRGAEDELDFTWSDHLRAQDFCFTTPTGKQLMMPDMPSFGGSGSVKGNCGMAGNEIYVTSQGDVFPCKLITGPEYLGGNLRSQRLAEILSSTLFETLRSASVGKGHLRDCERCYVRGSCGGGCRAYHMADSDAMEKNHRPFCRMLRQTKVVGYWLTSGMDSAEVVERRDEITVPFLVSDDHEHPVFRDWQRTIKRKRPLPVQSLAAV